MTFAFDKVCLYTSTVTIVHFFCFPFLYEGQEVWMSFARMTIDLPVINRVEYSFETLGPMNPSGHSFIEVSAYDENGW